jgi:hypothetical protein
MPLDFSSYTNKYISLDNDLFAYQKERKRIQPPVSAPNPPTIHPTTPILPPSPIELNSTQKKAYHRANNLYTYYSQPSHFIQDYPYPGRKKFSNISYASTTALPASLPPNSTPTTTPTSLTALIPYKIGKESR